MSDAFCDFLGVTFSNEDWETVRGEITPTLDSIGAQVEFDSERETLWRLCDGTVKAKRYGPVTSLGASGAVLAALRFAKSFGAYLSAIGTVRHRVTRLDASKDIKEPTAPVIDRLVEQSCSPGGLSLTRKRVLPRHVTRLLARGVDGVDTGTCYVGSRTAEVRACIYDKRQERIDRGLLDVGPLTRYELRVKSGIGATLRDAMEPTALFWHFMAPGVLPRPDGVGEWVAHGEGFSVDWPDRPSPASRLVRRVGSSAELQALCRLADEAGPYGLELLLGEVRKLHGSRVWAQPTEAASDAQPESPGVVGAIEVSPTLENRPRAC